MRRIKEYGTSIVHILDLSGKHEHLLDNYKAREKIFNVIQTHGERLGHFEKGEMPVEAIRQKAHDLVKSHPDRIFVVVPDMQLFPFVPMPPTLWLVHKEHLDDLLGKRRLKPIVTTLYPEK
jgi:hypothetical protein